MAYAVQDERFPVAGELYMVADDEGLLVNTAVFAWNKVVANRVAELLNRHGLDDVPDGVPT